MLNMASGAGRVVLTHFTQELKRQTLKLEAEPSQLKACAKAKAFGQLVQLGFDVAVFTPAAYQRGGLPRPSKEPSSCGRLRT